MYRKLMLLGAVVALMATACGDGDAAGDDVASLSDVVVSDTAAAAGEDVPVDSEQALLDFTQCMRDNGIDIDDPTVDAEGNLRLSRPGNFGAEGGDGPSSFDREAAQAARERCSTFLDGAALGFRDVDRTAIEDTLVEYASCVRDNGFDMPDPDFSGVGPGQGGGPGGGPFGAIDQDDPAFQTADEACRDIFSELPGAGRFGRGPGGDGGSG